MKKTCIIPLFCLLFLGCQNGQTSTPVNPYQQPVEKEEKTETPAQKVLTEEEAKQMAEDFIKNMDQYKAENGYHLEQIEILPADCDGCFDLEYEFRMQNKETAEVTGVGNVKVYIRDGKISDSVYSESEGTPVN